VTFSSPTTGNVTGSIVIAKSQPTLQYLCGDDISDSGAQTPHDPTVPCPLFTLTDTYGNYGVNVGTSNVPSGTSPAVILSVFAPTQVADKAAWKMSTYLDPSLANYVPFVPDVGGTTASATATTNIPGGTTGGSNGKTVVNIMTDLIGHMDVQGVPNWQLVGVPGGMNRSTKTSSFAAQTFLIAVKEKCFPDESPCNNIGAPFSLWNYSASQNNAQNNGLGTVTEAQAGTCDSSDSNGSECNSNGVNGVGDFNDEALVLAGGTVGVDFETNGGATNIANIKGTFVSGLGIALNQNDQGASGYCSWAWHDTYFQDANSLSPDFARVWYPVGVDSSGNPLKAPASASLGAGWSLITYNGSNYGDPSQLGCGGTPTGTTCTPVVDMVIQADDTGTSATWLAASLGGTNNSVAGGPGLTVNTLTSLQPGQPYFVHLSAAATAFTFR